MKLVLYSGGSASSNRALFKEAQSQFLSRSQVTISFVPVESQYVEEDFRDFRSVVKGADPKQKWDLRCIAIDENFSKTKEKQLFSSDAIFLGGGNTYYFLKHLREKGLIAKLRAFVKRGGVLMGLSAGSILMTPNIVTASVPSVEADENDVGIQNLTALNLVPFEFVAHYEKTKKIDRELIEYSSHIKRPIYACTDGSGIVVKGKNLQFVGNVTVFYAGKKFPVQ